MARSRAGLLVAALGAALGAGAGAGCDPNPYCFNCADGGSQDLVVSDIQTASTDWAFAVPDLMTAQDMCVVSNNGVEICDHVDNDCNGVIDDVDPARLAKDPNNCGRCFNVCDYNATHQFGVCVADADGGVASDGGVTPVGHCAPGDCAPGWVHLATDKNPGCNYQCLPTNGGVEICDGKDNDCNGVIDDGFGYPNYNLDVNNCGACGTVCVLPGAVPGCATNPLTGKGQCAVDHCINDGVDTYRHKGYQPGVLNTTGCEYHCPRPSSTKTLPHDDCDSVPCSFPAEVCNGVDDDCNFLVDDNPQDANVGCAGACPGGDVRQCVGQCRAGIDLCVAGVLVCEGSRGPAPEVCDGTDNDCDGLIDDHLTDAWLGQACCPSGNLADCKNSGAGSRCAVGTSQCAQGGRACVGAVAQAPETCNGIDDDCNGIVDDVAGIGSPCTGNGTNTNGACTASYQCLFAMNKQPGVGPAGLSCTQKVGPAKEVCNGVDDDCDGVVDDNLTDGGGACGNSCPGGLLANCIGACRAGVVTCIRGSNTCVGGVGPAQEVCNGIDDDCNGKVDDIPAIGLPCTDVSVNTQGTCTAKWTCNGKPGPGLQGLTCAQVQGPVPETCNGLDDDCDGVIDDHLTDVGVACGINCPGGLLANCVGACKAGATVCQGGLKVCSGSTGPSPEVCDGIDNDCNGVVDDGFGYPNYASDPNNCGKCGNVCGLQNAVSGCHADLALDGSGKGVCYVVACSNTNAKGWSYVPNVCGGSTPARDGPMGVGCNYACPVWPPSPEVCDGKDNNCNGQIDELKSGCAPDGLVAPGNFCATLGVCAGQNIPVNCQGANGWKCDYSKVAAIELDANGNLPVLEKICDGKDGNCNGVVDLDGFPSLGQACVAGLGVCQGAGVIACQNPTTAACNAVSNPAAATDELCNNKDDDCNGLVDERSDYTDGGGHTWHGWKDAMVAVTSGGATVYVYSYEASRTDATAASGGGNTARACSVAGVMPWADVTQTQAAAACAAILDSKGKPMRLCTDVEWQAACEGPIVKNTPRWSLSVAADTYVAQICNDTNEANVPATWATGSSGAQSVAKAEYCYTDWGGGSHLWDMSGNLFEWTSTAVTVGGVTYYKERGGSASSPSAGATCEFDFDIQRPGFVNSDLGFRCCADNSP